MKLMSTKKWVLLTISALLGVIPAIAQPGLVSFNLPANYESQNLWTFSKSAEQKDRTGSSRLFGFHQIKRAQTNSSNRYLFWADSSLTKASALTGLFNFETGSLASEWLVDGFGMWRLSAGSALTVAKDSTVKDFQSFINGGGNLFVKAATPIFLWVNANHPSKRYFSLYFSPKVGALLPGLGQSQGDSINWNLDAAVEAHLKIAGDKEKIALFSIIRSGISVGSKAFVKNITADKRQLFGYTVGSVGLMLNKNVLVQLNFPIRMGGIEDPIDKVPSSITVSILADR
jgi:hypothetical protein